MSPTTTDFLDVADFAAVEQRLRDGKPLLGPPRRVAETLTLLTYSRRESYTEFGPLDLAPLLENVGTICRKTFDR